jgi:hypothetical protein
MMPTISVQLDAPEDKKLSELKAIFNMSSKSDVLKLILTKVLNSEDMLNRIKGDDTDGDNDDY